MILKNITITLEGRPKQVEILDIDKTVEQILHRIVDDQIHTKNLTNQDVSYLMTNKEFIKAITKTTRLLKKSLNKTWIGMFQRG